MANARMVTLTLATACVLSGFGLVLQARNQQAVATWVAVGAPQFPSGAAATTLADGGTLIAGGLGGDGVVTDNVVAFDPVRNEITSIGQLLAPRAGHTATLLPDGRVLVAGGSVLGVISGDVELFDPASGGSTLSATLNAPRTGHAAAALADGTVLIVGGTSLEGAVLANAELVDPASGAVTVLGAALQSPRTRATATTLVDGRVLVAGGNDGVQDLASGEMFNPWAGTFSPIDPASHLSVPRSGHTALRLPHNNGVLIAGGTSNGVAVAAADVFVPAEFPDPYSYGMGQFVATAAMTAARAGAIGGPADDNGYAFVMGGGAPGADVYRYATLKTDKDDYAPGERAIISGSGWQPGETVRLVFQEDPAVHDDYVINVTADAEGNIYWDQWAPDWHDLNVRFFLSASDSRSRAQITFTDGLPQAVALSPSSVTVTAGASAEYQVNVDMGGNSNPCTITLEVISPLPAGVTASFSDNPINASNVDFSRTLTLTTTSTGPLPSQTPAGTYLFTVRATRGSCQGSSPSPTIEGTLVVNAAAAPTALDVAPASGTYGGSLTLSATLIAGGTGVSGTSVGFALNGAPVGSATTDTGGVATLTGISLAGIDAGSYPGAVTASFAGDATHLASSGSNSLTVNQATATVVVNGYTGVYDGDPHGATGTATGVNDEDLTSLLTLGDSFTDVPGGTANWTFAGNTNYNAASGNVAIEISKVTPTIVVMGYTGVYDGDPHGATGTATGVKDEDLSDQLDLGAQFTDVPGGMANWSFSGGTNYNDFSGSVEVSISKADAIIMVTGYAGVYDGDPHGATGAATGAKGVDLGEQLDLGARFTDVPGGTAHWSFTGGTNYNDAAGSVAIAISKADATIVVHGFTGTYDGDPHGATGSATGVKAEDLSALLDLGDSFTDAPGGTAHWSFAGNNNYNEANGNAAIVIDKADADIAVNGYTGVYDGDPHGASGTATGVKGEDLSSLLSLGASFTDVPGGTAEWTFAGNNNYDTASGTAAIVIEKADATITVNGYTGVYDGDAHGATGAATGVKGEGLSALLNLGASFTDAPGGPANWTFAGNTNYNSASGSVAIAIEKANATITVTGYTGIFDGNPYGATGSATGVLGEDLTSLLDLGATFTMPPGGTANWSFAGNTNYHPANGSVGIVINPWHFTGFYQPVTMGGSTVVNTVKGGSTVPLKFNIYLSAGGTELTSVDHVMHFQVFTATCQAAVWEDPIDFTTTGGTSLRYDTVGRQFVQNWQTPRGAGSCYRVVMTAKDGSQLTAYFKTK